MEWRALVGAREARDGVSRNCQKDWNLGFGPSLDARGRASASPCQGEAIVRRRSLRDWRSSLDPKWRLGVAVWMDFLVVHTRLRPGRSSS